MSYTSCYYTSICSSNYCYKTTYYNMFRMHKKSVGIIQPRGNLYYNVPQMNLFSFLEQNL